MQPVIVRCKSEYKYAQMPAEILWGGEIQSVINIRGQWTSPDGPVFEVTIAGDRYVRLKYVESDDTWYGQEITD